jgi:Na+-driven multidrug efflux pump
MVVTASGLYSRLIVGCVLVIAIVGSSAGAVLTFLVMLFPGEDHDFEGPAIYIACGVFLALAVLSGFLFWRNRSWLFSAPQTQNVSSNGSADATRTI